MQGVIKSFDPGSGDGVILCDTDFREYDLADGALVGSEMCIRDSPTRGPCHTLHTPMP